MGFCSSLWYNKTMEKEKITTSNAETVTISRAEYGRLQAQRERVSALEKQVEILMEAIRLARHKRFGASSERIDDDGMEQLSLLFDEAEVYAEQEAKEDAGEGVMVAAHRRHKKHEYALENLPENIPVEVKEHRLPESELVCPECGNTMV